MVTVRVERGVIWCGSRVKCRGSRQVREDAKNRGVAEAGRGLRERRGGGGEVSWCGKE